MGNISAPMIESRNWAFTLGYLILGMYVFYRTRERSMSDGNTQVLHSLGWMAIGGGLNSMWFAISRHLAEPGESWNTTMFEWRWLAVVATALIFVWGVCGVLRGFEDASTWAQIGFYAVLLIVAATFGIY